MATRIDRSFLVLLFPGKWPVSKMATSIYPALGKKSFIWLCFSLSTFSFWHFVRVDYWHSNSHPSNFYGRMEHHKNGHKGPCVFDRRGGERRGEGASATCITKTCQSIDHSLWPQHIWHLWPIQSCARIYVWPADASSCVLSLSLSLVNRYISSAGSKVTGDILCLHLFLPQLKDLVSRMLEFLWKT